MAAIRASEVWLAFGQDDLFRPASRTTDPETSHSAEREVNLSGRRSTQCSAVEDDVLAHNGATAGEIARRIGLDRHTVSKRTADLANQGRIHRGPTRVCLANHRAMLSWWIHSQEETSDQ